MIIAERGAALQVQPVALGGLWLDGWVGEIGRNLARLAGLKNVTGVFIALLTLLSECCGDCLRPLQRRQFRRVPQGRNPPSRAA